MTKFVFHYDIEELIPYIDWSYFFHAWGLEGKENDKKAMEETRHDAEVMLKKMNGKYHTHAIFALCNANSEGDDIIIENTRFPLLRQQHAKEETPNLCLSDFISPESDKIGLFATSTDQQFGSEYSCDIYRNLIVQILADRLAEATATLLHLNVRTKTELWGYATNENLAIKELLQEKHQGIRPAVGYPSLPDQSVIFIIDKLLGLKEIGIELTPNGAMHPHASVCGLMLSHPATQYFAVGKITPEQFEDYSSRRDIATDELLKFLSKNLE